MSYTTKVYRKQGGDKMIVAAGGKVVVEAGGAIEAAEGSIIPVETQDAIADLGLTASETYDGTELEAVAAKVDAILAALRAAKVIAAE